LMKRKPSLVMQTAKAGRSAQARKTYKLTAAGVREVKAMIAGASEENQ
jgi:DNA-binding PadR family transcriptional regulator